MDKNKEKCDSIGLQYKQKYDKLLSLVNGYENQNITVSKEQQKNMKQLSDIISNTKELLSENEFTKLRNEQDNIMKEFYHLENVKNDNPYSNNALEFTNDSGIADESLDQFSQQENKKEETESQTKNQFTLDKVKNMFSLDSFANISKKTNNITNEVRKDLEKTDTQNNNSIEIQHDIQERRNDVLNTTQNEYQITKPINMPANMPLNMPANMQPCYPNKPNFIGLPSIQIVNVESSCQSKRKNLSKYKKSKKIHRNKRPSKQEPLKRVPSKRKRKIKKDAAKCHKEDYIPTFKDKSNNHKIF